MKEIILFRGEIALVDDEDYEYVSQFKWYAKLNKRNGYKYAITNNGGKNLSMHRMILGAEDPKIPVDHINMNGLDNRTVNIRLSTPSFNAINRGKQKNNTSGYKGVFLRKEYKNPTWKAAIRVNQKLINIGTFDNPEDAARAYDSAALDYF